MRRNLGESEPEDTAKLFDTIRQYLDFIMWCVQKYHGESTLKYEWFLAQYPDGKPGSPGVTAEITEQALSFLSEYGTYPINWTTNVFFHENAPREQPISEFYELLCGQLRSLTDDLLKSTKVLPPWFPRDRLFPRGKTFEEFHADYLYLRESLLNYYVEFVSKNAIRPPFYGFPEPVPLFVADEAEREECTSSEQESAGRSVVPDLHGSNDWRWSGLPDRLRQLAEALENKGSLRARDIRDNIENGEEPSRILKDFRGHPIWGKWVSRFIGHDRPFYWFKKSS